MPPGAVATVTLEDVSRMDVTVEVIATRQIQMTSQVPIPFRLPYNPDSIIENHSYSVRAKIHVRGQLVFTTDTNHPVITRGAGTDVDLLLKRVPRRT